MAPVTVDAASIVGGGSGLTGWSARSTFLMEDVGDSFTNPDGASVTQIGDNATREIPAQSFTATGSYSLASVVLPLNKSGSPTDNVYIEIRSDNSDAPSTTVLATSGNVSASTGVSAAQTYVKFDFASPPSLTNATRYWIVARRTGAIDAVNFVQWALSGLTAYANGRVLQWNGTTWTNPGAQWDCSFVCLKTTTSVYQVTQDTTPKLRMWKSTDNGTNWSEINSAGAPTVNSATKPFSAWATWEARGSAPGVALGGQGIYVGYFSGTNTGRIRRFDLVAQTWDSADIGAADFSTDVDFNRNIRVVASKLEADLYYTSLADDADLEYVRYDGTMGAQTQTLILTNAASSCYSDVVMGRPESTATSAFDAMFWYDITAGDFAVRTLAGATLGTETDLDATAADVETEHASGVFQPYDGDTDVVVAFIDADGTLEERTATLGVTSASMTLGTQHQVAAGTSYAGRSLATCRLGSDLYIFAGTATGIDVYKDTGASGTWGSVENWLTGLTSAVLSTAVPITGVGILVSYVDGGNTKVNLYTVSVPASLTVIAATASAAGEAVTFDAASTLTAGTATAPAAGGTVALAGQARLPVTEATAPAAGANVNLAAAAKLTVTPSAAPSQGEAVDLRAAVAATFTVAPATAPAAADSVLTGNVALIVTAAAAPAAGEDVSLDAAATLTVTEATAAAQGQGVLLTAAVAASLVVSPATAPAQGEGVTLDAAASMAIAAATAPAQGEAVTLDVAANLLAGTATALAQGEAVTFDAAATLTLGTAPASAEGENVSLSGGTSVAGTLAVAPATAPAAGETVAFVALAVFSVDTATADAQGEAVTLDAAALLTIATATADAAGGTASLTGQGRLAVTETDAVAAADSAFFAAATLGLTAATATADAGAIVLTGGAIGDVAFALDADVVLTFRLMAETVLALRTQAEPVLELALAGDYYGD